MDFLAEGRHACQKIDGQEGTPDAKKLITRRERH